MGRLLFHTLVLLRFIVYIRYMYCCCAQSLNCKMCVCGIFFTLLLRQPWIWLASKTFHLNTFISPDQSLDSASILFVFVSVPINESDIVPEGKWSGGKNRENFLMRGGRRKNLSGCCRVDKKPDKMLAKNGLSKLVWSLRREIIL